MKKFSVFVCVAMLSFVWNSTAGYAADMDLMLKQIITGVRENNISTNKAVEGTGDTALIPCILKSQNPFATLSKITDRGGRANIISEDILSAWIPSQSIDEILRGEEILTAEAGLPLSSKMDTARIASGVNVVQNGSALGTAYNGKNVVIGVIDETLDYGNEDFKGSDGYTRIQYMMQTSASSTLECTKRTIADSSCEITDGGQSALHGTHVTGIAAGSNTTYTGVAPQSDIMFVFVDPTDSDTNGSFATEVLDGASKIFEKATLMNKAAVINISLGTSIGAHDGTSLLEEGLSELTAAKVGRIIVNAAGNEQYVPLSISDVAARTHLGGIHASIDVTDGSSQASRIMILNGSGSTSTFTGGTFVDVWLNGGQKDNCSIQTYGYANGRADDDFTFPGLASTDSSTLASENVPFATSTTNSVTATGGGVQSTIAIDQSDSRNSKPRAIVLFSPETGRSGSVLQTMWFDVVIRASGGDCTGNMWLFYDYIPFHDFLLGVSDSAYNVGDGAKGLGYSLQNGDSFYTTTIPATATGVIAAGSWMPEKPISSGVSEWTSDDGTLHNEADEFGTAVDGLSAFSSLGPTADGRTKPDVVTPGEPILSTRATQAAASSNETVNNGLDIEMAGTSMASPHLAGIVALLLERNNTLGVDAVRTALANGATTTGMTSVTADPANSYGAGKANAASILTSVAQDTSAYSGTGDLDPVVPGSSSSCTISSNRCGQKFMAIFSIVLVSSIFMLVRRFLNSRKFYRS